MDSLMTTSELVQKKISNFFNSDHTKETPHHADDLACDFEGFNNDSHKLDYSSDATTVSFNTLKLEDDELKQKKILDLEAVDDCSDSCSMDSLELAKLDEKVFAGYISNDDTKSLDCSDCSMDSLDKKVLDKKKMIKRVLEEAGYRRSDATTDSCESLYIID
ncbi:unnamed protein product [Meganyctiphanes norvegica]|uniref:Uncharacterized protein n=1 Tax=Meganyctiphanes norvegica TaxID=48144 RepID=A0AAV2RWX2_MEGNR